MSKSTIAATLLALLLCAAASADEPAAEPVPMAPTASEQPEPAPPAPEPAVPEPAAPTAPAASEPLPAYAPGDGRAAIDAWHDTRGIRYGTDMLFPFTRGMGDAGITGWARWPMGLVTVPLDLAFLPTGILAGLFGG